MMNLRNRQVVVVGLGKSGVAALELLKRQGAKARVTEVSAKDSVTSLAKKLKAEGIDVEFGRHTEGFLKGADLMVTSPGVAGAALPLKWAKDNKIKVIDEIELAYRFCKAPIIAITGTNGKSTTTSLVGHIFARAGRDTLVCGNIGRPFSGEIQNLKEDSIVVLEASSFQLSRIDAFKPRVAVFLNVTQNHLDRHSDFKEYFGAKMRIFENQAKDDWAVVNCEDRNILKNINKIRAKKILFSPNLGEKISGNFASVAEGELFIKFGGKRFGICKIDDLKIRGRHNIENALAAISCAFIFDIPAKMIADAVKTFVGLEHRCEYVATINGVRFINDSKSTTVDAAIKALDACGGNIILIAGGRDKNSDFGIIGEHIKNKVRVLILIGEAADKIKNALAQATDIKKAPSLEDAAELAFRLAKRGESILLSPMCTSFDMFEDFQHRGKVFKEAVNRMSGSACVSQG